MSREFLTTFLTFLAISLFCRWIHLSELIRQLYGWSIELFRG